MSSRIADTPVPPATDRGPDALLGHSSVRMTLRYAHLGDREIEAAAERIGEAIGAIMGV